MLHFADRVEDILNDHHIDSDDIIYVKFFLNSTGQSSCIFHVINKILPWKQHISDRNDNFFYKNKEIFGKLPEQKVNYFSDLWMSGKLDEADKNEIWDFFDAFITYAEEYKKKI